MPQFVSRHSDASHRPFLRTLFPALLLAALALSFSPANSSAQSAAPPKRFLFRDVGEACGLFPHLDTVHGHAAGWGDVDGDGWVDLYVGTFHQQGGKPNLFFRNSKGHFQLDGQESLQISTRASAALFADFDNDHDLDLYVSSMPSVKGGNVGCTLFRNDGGGKFTNIADNNGACPKEFGGRSAAALDFDGDGLLDLLVGEDPIPGYNGSKTRSTRLFRNLGKLQFADVTQDAGLPAGIPGLGVAAGDVNNDTWPDLFIASNNGGNLLFLNTGRGQFREAPVARTTFAWEGTGGDNMVCGVCLGDVNRDGLLDLAIGQHFSTPWLSPVANRLYLNRGVADGVPTFEDVTAAVGLKPLPLKGPHLELQDFDNDGWPDLYVSIVKFATDGTPHPLIFRNHGVQDGLPRFTESMLAVNDFPNEEDRQIKRSGTFFDKMIKDKKIIYMAPGPSADFDNDGRLDLFLPNWWTEARSLLLRNETDSGHWLQIEVRGPDGVNVQGIGARVEIYTAGQLGDRRALLGTREIASGFGYASAQPAIAHFGLGDATSVDVQVILPHGKGIIKQASVKANQRLVVQ